MKNHPFHLVTPSPWPMILSMNLMNLLMSAIMIFQFQINWILFMSLITMLFTMAQWWRDVIRESTFQGMHSFMVLDLMKLGMILFIISELFFFISFFWAYLHSAISPSIEIGMTWPPKNIIPFNPYDIPMLNTIILISSGFSITWSHNALLENDIINSSTSLTYTVLLGIYFSMMQLIEYYQASFTYNDSVYSSIFFMSTGFHGTHVNMGIIFLMSCLLRMHKDHFSKTHHFHFEAASWYWHFVDIIWLILYLLIYWWMYF